MDKHTVQGSSKAAKSFHKRKQHQNDKYKKFIGNQKEGQGFADKRKKKMQYEYMKMMKKEKRKTKPYDMTKNLEVAAVDAAKDKTETVPRTKRKREKSTTKINKYTMTQHHHQKMEAEKKIRNQELQVQKTQRDSALGKYKQEKQRNFKKLCKRTYKGQPVMRNQIEVLLSKIVKDAT